MKEIVVRHYFEGYATAVELERDAAGSVERERDANGVLISRHHITDMAVDFEVEPAHIARLVDDCLAGAVSLETVDAVCFCLEASDTFGWDVDAEPGSRVEDAVFWLGTSEINFPLTPETLGKIRHYALTGEDLLHAKEPNPGRAGKQLHQSKIREPGA